MFLLFCFQILDSGLYVFRGSDPVNLSPNQQPCTYNQNYVTFSDQSEEELQSLSGVSTISFVHHRQEHTPHQRIYDLNQQNPDLNRLISAHTQQSPDRLQQNPDLNRRIPAPNQQSSDHLQQNPDLNRRIPAPTLQSPDLNRRIPAPTLQSPDHLQQIIDDLQQETLPPHDRSERRLRTPSQMATEVNSSYLPSIYHTASCE